MTQPVHFAWMGNPPNPIGRAVDTVNAVARLCKSREVRFWCLPDAAATFRPRLSHFVTLKTLTRIETKQLKLGGAWKERALDIFHVLLEHRAFAACKDLLNLILLHTYGGYTCDTTCFVASSPVLNQEAIRLGVTKCSVDKAFSKKHTEPHFPLVADDTIFHQPGLLNAKAITIGYDPNVPDGLEMPHIDVWAMYSPKEHDVFKYAIKSYVRRAETMGLTTANLPLNNAGISGYGILRRGIRDGATDPEKAERNEFIGQLISHSVYDGLVQVYGQDDVCDIIVANSFKAHGYLAPDADEDSKPTDICPELGIIKEYNGSWRV